MTDATREPGQKRRRWTLLLVYVVFLFLLLELCSRAFLAMTMGASFVTPGDGIYQFYPEVRDTLAMHHSKGARPARVLLLGGSVLAPGEQDIEQVLVERLGKKLGRDVHVFNVARHAHMSPDSLRKYRMLADQRFDLVVFYHAINDVRANICPDEVFRQDYSHMLWHRIINRFTTHREINALAHPYVVHLLGSTISERIWPPALVPMKTAEGEVTPEGENFTPWLDHGSKIKTEAAFGRNIRAVADLARKRGEPLLLMTFAHYLAPGYTLDKFEKKALDYGKHEVPTEVWGRPAHVNKGVEAHNAVIRKIAKERGGVHFVDMARVISNGKASYDDICHLTLAGRKAWVDAMLGEAVKALKN